MVIVQQFEWLSDSRGMTLTPLTAREAALAVQQAEVEEGLVVLISREVARDLGVSEPERLPPRPGAPSTPLRLEPGDRGLVQPRPGGETWLRVEVG